MLQPCRDIAENTTLAFSRTCWEEALRVAVKMVIWQYTAPSLWFFFLIIDLTEVESWVERGIDLLFHLFMYHWLILVCALTGDRTCNLSSLVIPGKRIPQLYFNLSNR